MLACVDPDHARPPRRRRLAASSRPAARSARSSARSSRPRPRAVRPFTAVPDWFRSQRRRCATTIATLEAENSELREPGRHRRLRPQPAGRVRRPHRGRRAPRATPWCRPAWSRIGPRQSFSRTVTIDAGSDAGVGPDMTVRQQRRAGRPGAPRHAARPRPCCSSSTPTRSSAAGSATSMEVGFLHGRGDLGDDGRLDLELVDDAVVPAKGDVVVTWGSQGGAPYVAGVPIGRVDRRSTASLRETSQRAVIEPFVDFGALDLVGVVVPVRHRRATARVDRGRREPAMSARPRRCAASPAAWSLVALVLQVTLFPHLAVAGRRAQPRACSSWSPPRWSAGPQFAAVARLRRRPAARPRPAGRPRRRPLGAGAGRRRLRRRAGCARTPRPTADRRGRRRSPPASFVGTSVFALTGLLLGDPVVGVRRPAPGDPGRRAVGRAARRRSCCRG